MIRMLLGMLMIAMMLVTGITASAQSKRHAQTTKGRICGDITVHCKTSVQFDPWDLPFEVPKNGVIYESEWFYVVILKSEKANDNCDNFIPEETRLKAQTSFVHAKVFTNRCEGSGSIFYSNITQDVLFMGAFAGRTRTEANYLLANVKAIGEFPGAYIKRVNTGFNGT